MPPAFTLGVSRFSRLRLVSILGFLPHYFPRVEHINSFVDWSASRLPHTLVSSLLELVWNLLSKGWPIGMKLKPDKSSSKTDLLPLKPHSKYRFVSHNSRIHHLKILPHTDLVWAGIFGQNSNHWPRIQAAFLDWSPQIFFSSPNFERVLFGTDLNTLLHWAWKFHFNHWPCFERLKKNCIWILQMLPCFRDMKTNSKFAQVTEKKETNAKFHSHCLLERTNTPCPTPFSRPNLYCLFP